MHAEVSWALLLFAFATRDWRLCFRLECSTITTVFRLPSVFLCWRLTSLSLAATYLLIALCQKGNLNHRVNRSNSELTLTIVGIAQICSTTRRGENGRLFCVSSFAPNILSRVTEIFFVNLYIGHWVGELWCWSYLQLFKDMALQFLKENRVWEQQTKSRDSACSAECSSSSLSVPCFRILMKNAWPQDS